jgi:hypothetical protein
MTYRVIVAGSRQIRIATCMRWLDIWLTTHPTPSMVISGAAAGPDAAGISWATKHNIPVFLFPANWDKHGRAAGPIRNKEMAKFAALIPGGRLIAFWDGESRGTKNMIDEATLVGLEIEVVEP